MENMDSAMRNADDLDLFMQRLLMTADELKSMPKGSFVVMKTGCHPMKVKLKLFFQWGITFEKPQVMPDQGSRPVYYASRKELETAILRKYPLLKNKPAPARPIPQPLQEQAEQNKGLKTKRESE